MKNQFNIFFLLLLVLISCRENVDKSENNINPFNDDESYKTNQKEFKRLFESGLAFYNERNIDSAQNKFEQALKVKTIKDSIGIDMYINTVFYLSDIYSDNQDRGKQKVMLSEFIRNGSHNDKFEQTAVSSLYFTLGNIYQSEGNYQKNIDECINPNTALIEEKLINSKKGEERETWEILNLENMRNHLMALMELSDYQKELEVAIKLEKTIKKTFVNNKLRERLYMIYDPLMEHYLNTGKYNQANKLINDWKLLNDGMAPIHHLILNDKILKFANQTKNDSLKESVLTNTFKTYNEVENKMFYHDHYYVTALSDQLLNKKAISEMSYNKLDSLSNLILTTTSKNSQNIYSNPLAVYNGRADYYYFHKIPDSMKLNIEKHLALATKLNHNYEKLRHLQNLSDYYVLTKNDSEHSKMVNEYLKSKDINSAKDLKYKNVNKFNANSTKVHSYFAKNSLDLYHLNGNLESLKTAHYLWLFNINLLNFQKSNGTYSQGQKEIILESRKGILKTMTLLNALSHNTSKNAIELLEDSYSQEIIYEFYAKELSLNIDNQLTKVENERRVLQKKYYAAKLALDTLENKSNASTARKLKMQLNKINNDLSKLNPFFASLQATRFNLDKYQNKIKDSNSVLRYYQTDSLIYPVVIGRNFVKYGNPIDLVKTENLVKNLKSSLYNKQSIRVFSKELRDLLDLNGEKSNSQTIVADGILSKVPFELISEKYRNNVVSYSSSLSLMDIELTTNKYDRHQSLLAFNPKYDSKTFNTKTREIVERSGSYALPFAKEESAYITKLLDGKLFEDEQATKVNFIKNAPNYSIQHLAMHAVVDEENDYDAKLLFYGDKEEDYMNLNDIYNLNLNADLVTLSACNTAYGKIDPIEGAMSLSRAFQYAGARATLTSLWRVPDRETSIIMKSFYAHLKDGERKDVALKMAKDDYLKNTVEADLKHPYYWAGFILTGDTSPVITGTPWWYYVLGIGLLLLGFGTYKMFTSRKKRAI